MARGSENELNDTFNRHWTWRIPKRDAMGIYGILFYESDHKKQYYPTRKDEDACNTDGSQLR